MKGALTAAWVLTAFVVVAGLGGWALTGRPVFAALVGLGVLAAVGAVVTLRLPTAAAAPKESTPS